MNSTSALVDLQQLLCIETEHHCGPTAKAGDSFYNLL